VSEALDVHESADRLESTRLFRDALAEAEAAGKAYREGLR